MRCRFRWGGWPLLVVALAAGCDDDNTPGSTGTGGAGGTQDSGATGGTGGTPMDGGGDAITPPQGDGGLAPCLDRPGSLDLPPAGQLPCELLPPGFIAP